MLPGRQARQRGDAVVALHAVQGDVRIATLDEGVAREKVVDDLGFLKADDVGRGLVDQPQHQIEPQADGVDVPGDDAHGDAVRDEEKVRPNGLNDLDGEVIHPLDAAGQAVAGDHGADAGRRAGEQQVPRLYRDE